MRFLAIVLFLTTFALPATAVDVRSGVCDILEIAEFPDRVHVRCMAPIPGTNIQYFAESTANRDRANRLLSMFLMAQALGSQLFVRFDLDDMSAVSFSCLAADCRRPDWVQVQNPPAAAAPATAAALFATHVVLVPEPSKGTGAVAALCPLMGLAAAGRQRGSFGRRTSRTRSFGCLRVS